VNERNTRARRCYARLGFEDVRGDAFAHYVEARGRDGRDDLIIGLHGERRCVMRVWLRAAVHV
jgi:hypothetical protein